MFDDGSAVTLLETVIADQLNLKGKQFPLTLQWYNNKKSIEMSKRVTLEPEYTLKYITVRNLDLPVQSFLRYQYEHQPTNP